MDDLETVKRLLLAAALGGALGLEREWNQKDAGLRTNLLITMGSALFTIMSIDLSASSGGDATRIAAQIVTGVGFLGAGAIMRTGGNIRGLTTAATIWVNAAVGVAVGGGEYHVALIATAVTLVALLTLNPVERAMERIRSSRSPGRATNGESSEAGGAEP